MTIEVVKYHKGSGPRILTGYLGGINSTTESWMYSADVGDWIVGAFRYEGKDLVNRPGARRRRGALVPAANATKIRQPPSIGV